MSRLITRRRFIENSLKVAAVAPLLAGAGCGAPEVSSEREEASGSMPTFHPLQTGPVRDFRVVADIGDVEVVPGRPYRTWLYNGRFPGEEIRVREGERLRITLENRLPEGTTIHWHGVPVPNAMDGVPGVTQAPVAPGETFVYEFVAGPAGSYLYHSHAGMQLDRGLVGSLVIEEATPHIVWDREYTLVLDDFLPGEPRALAGGGGGMGMGRGMGMMGMATPPYTGLLVNGRLPEAAPVFEVRRGERVRLRIANPSGATTFRVAVAGHRMTVSHADGRPVEPATVDSLLIGMGERYDVVLECNNPGMWTLAAAPIEGAAPAARAFLRYAGVAASTPPEGQAPEGLRAGRSLRLEDLVSVEMTGSSARPDRNEDLLLSGGMMSSAWMINGQAYPDAAPIEVRQGERVRFRMTNHSMMLHPMHLHGHFFRVGRALKDTVIVPPHMGRVDFDFVADNPGDWLFHCHNLYHMESGMARVVRYTA
jgi:FtsP/CotA-like multicopper oxidase with cupredoxin domain